MALEEARETHPIKSSIDLSILLPDPAGDGWMAGKPSSSAGGFAGPNTNATDTLEDVVNGREA